MVLWPKDNSETTPLCLVLTKQVPIFRLDERERQAATLFTGQLDSPDNMILVVGTMDADKICTQLTSAHSDDATFNQPPRGRTSAHLWRRCAFWPVGRRPTQN